MRWRALLAIRPRIAWARSVLADVFSAASCATLLIELADAQIVTTSRAREPRALAGESP
jgi:hypothetical protein